MIKTFTIGAKKYPFVDFASASAAYSAEIDRLNVGSSRAPKGKLLDENGVQVGYISYNGNIWSGTTYVADAAPLYRTPAHTAWMASRGAA